MKFPIILTNGQQTVRLYKVSCRGKPLYQIAWREAGRRNRRSFLRLHEARQAGTLLLQSLNAQEAAVQRVAVADMESYVSAKRHIEPLGIPLHDAAESFARAQSELQGVSLLEAVRFYKVFHESGVMEKPLPELLEDYQASRVRAGVSQGWQKDLRHILKRFEMMFGKRRLHEIRAIELDRWLGGQAWSARTKNNHRKALSAFGAWCQSQGYWPKDRPTEFSAMQVWKDTPKAVEIFKPDEIRQWLAGADATLIPLLAIGAFAGLRTAEIERLDWKNIHLDRGFIEAAAELTKTRARRIVPISDNLKAWLAPHAQAQGAVVPYRSASTAIGRLSKKTGLTWVKNGLRHSYISYRLAIMPDTARVALECGNSPDIIFKHYRELVTEEDAKAWFGIMPE